MVIQSYMHIKDDYDFKLSFSQLPSKSISYTISCSQAGWDLLREVMGEWEDKYTDTNDKKLPQVITLLERMLRLSTLIR